MLHTYTDACLLGQSIKERSEIVIGLNVQGYLWACKHPEVNMQFKTLLNLKLPPKSDWQTLSKHKWRKVTKLIYHEISHFVPIFRVTERIMCCDCGTTCWSCCVPAACALSSPTTCTKSSRKCSTSSAGWRKSRLELPLHLSSKLQWEAHTHPECVCVCVCSASQP